MAMQSYWPWWLGALALGAVTVAHWRLLGRLLGVSGVFVRLVRAPSEPAPTAAEAELEADPAAMAAALEAATLALIAQDPAAQAMLAASAEAPEAPAPATAAASAPAAAAPRVPWTAHAVFVGGLVAGGLLARFAARGDVGFELDLGGPLSGVFGNGWAAGAVLLLGAVLVGFGTALSGGCTSGHGLSGCSRFQPGSLVATATFMGVAIAVSLLLAAVAR